LARGLSFELRLSLNHGCSIELCEITRSISTLRPSAWAVSITVSKSDSVPNIGSMSQ